MAGKRATKDVREVLEMAKRNGVDNNYLFKTTFERYQTQVGLLEELKQAITEYGATVEKEYVKGRPNLTANPAISEYNRLSSTANTTVATLIKIFDSLKKDKDEKDALQDFLNE